MQAWSIYKHAVVAVFTFLLWVVLKGDVGGGALTTHGNYIDDHGKPWKNHGIVFFNFCGNPVTLMLQTKNYQKNVKVFVYFMITQTQVSHSDFLVLLFSK